ncbi:uncharacterized protein LOC123314447 [Coccinella septempunctata]|uniref:uncharacterized protein LOC123314447 n=1 Tax=Coccinella septempunctata TaxID=41139 RepID=UPI001D07CACB|nr:uncharacterized protein LOC123314447 [Coccinella septempunctata]
MYMERGGNRFRSLRRRGTNQNPSEDSIDRSWVTRNRLNTINQKLREQIGSNQKIYWRRGSSEGGSGCEMLSRTTAWPLTNREECRECNETSTDPNIRKFD